MIRHLVAAVSFILIGAHTALAHQASTAYIEVAQSEVALKLRYDIAIRDLDTIIPLDSNRDGRITWGEVKEARPVIEQLVKGGLMISSGSIACSLAEDMQLQVADRDFGSFAVAYLDIDCPGLSDDLTLNYQIFFDRDAQHRVIVQIHTNDFNGTEVLTKSRRETVIQRGASESTLQLLGKFLIEGIRHILEGIDHLMFLLVLLIPAVLIRRENAWQPAPKLKPAAIEILKIVSSFTVAHSITLVLVTLGLVALPSRLVESVIALSVLAAAIENLHPVFWSKRWVVVFLFGLIHGFGFASVLGELGLSQGTMIASLFGFNVGVEVGQIIFVMAVMPFLYLVRKKSYYQSRILPLGSILIGFIAILWIIDRVLDIGFMPF